MSAPSLRFAAAALFALAGVAGAQAPATRAPRTILIRGESLVEANRLLQSRDTTLRPAFDELMIDADVAMRLEPPTPMQKQLVPPSGDKHDYMSTAPYWWPDSTKKDGLPYVRRDGYMNPQSRLDHDGLRFGRMADAVEALSLAYWFVKKPSYADKAATLLRTWFIDPKTRMNPHLRYAQAVPGVNEGRGIGILDLRDAPKVLDAVRLLEGSPAWRASDAAAFQRWWREYLTWLVTSENGKDERDEANNHGTWYDAQALPIALFVGDKVLAKAIVDSTRTRIAGQLAADGRQPEELARTRPVHYSFFNLDAFTRVAEMSRHVGVDLWSFTAPRGSSLGAALRFVAPYADPSLAYEKKDVAKVIPEVWEAPMTRARAAFGDPVFARAIAQIPDAERRASRYALLYPPRSRPLVARDTLLDRAWAFAEARIRRAATTMAPAGGYPRLTRADGTWETRPIGEWTSGFFGGTLWYLYQGTRAPEWKTLAEKWTHPLEPNKLRRSTHDLGFMIFDAFGHEYLLTGDAHARDVVLEASRSLSTRFNERVGAIKSWDLERATDHRSTWKYPVIVDNLMNLEMLFWASRQAPAGPAQAAADSSFARIAAQHARTSAKAHVRPDGSTAHVALFDPTTGALERTVTWQGYADTSAWSRGQAWAIHGFSASARVMGDTALLGTARKVADWFLAHLPPDQVPYWDFRHPDIPRTERDASAAAIAASGLYDLARQVDAASAMRYRAAADRIVHSLARNYLDRRPAGHAVIAHATGQRPQGNEIDVGLVYADYYFLEAILRGKGMFLE